MNYRLTAIINTEELLWKSLIKIVLLLLICKVKNLFMNTFRFYIICICDIISWLTVDLWIYISFKMIWITYKFKILSVTCFQNCFLKFNSKLFFLLLFLHKFFCFISCLVLLIFLSVHHFLLDLALYLYLFEALLNIRKLAILSTIESSSPPAAAVNFFQWHSLSESWIARWISMIWQSYLFCAIHYSKMYYFLSWDIYWVYMIKFWVQEWPLLTEPM